MIEIERLSNDRLSREVWRFEIFAPRFGERNVINAIVSFYAMQRRRSTRHKWRVEPGSQFSDWDRRQYHSGIKAEDVPLPDAVAEQLRNSLTIAVHGPTISKRDII